MKILKKLFQDIFFVNIENVKITHNIIVKILNLFIFNDLLIIIDSLEKNNDIFKMLEDKKIQYITYDINEKITNCVIILPKEKLDILKNIISINIDLYFLGINNINKLTEYLDSLNNISNRLLNAKIADFIIDFWNSEKCIEITADSTIYKKDFITKKIEEILHQSN